MLRVTKSYKKFHHFNKCESMGFKRAKIVACAPRSDYRVWLRFDDGLEGEVNLSHLESVYNKSHPEAKLSLDKKPLNPK